MSGRLFRINDDVSDGKRYGRVAAVTSDGRVSVWWAQDARSVDPATLTLARRSEPTVTIPLDVAQAIADEGDMPVWLNPALAVLDAAIAHAIEAVPPA